MTGSVISAEPTAASDRELVVRCQTGDATAFDELVVRHQRRALNVAYQVLQDREDAAEVAQDAFVKVFQNIEAFRGECEFTTWLHQIVINLARNKHRWWRCRGRKITFSLDCPQEMADGVAERQLAGTSPEPDAEATRTEFLERLAAEMARLPRRFREALVLRNVEEKSYQEIALILDCSVGTVKSRIARAREILRRRMKDKQ